MVCEFLIFKASFYTLVWQELVNRHCSWKQLFCCLVFVSSFFSVRVFGGLINAWPWVRNEFCMTSLTLSELFSVGKYYEWFKWAFFPLKGLNLYHDVQNSLPEDTGYSHTSQLWWGLLFLQALSSGGMMRVINSVMLLQCLFVFV